MTWFGENVDDFENFDTIEANILYFTNNFITALVMKAWVTCALGWFNCWKSFILKRIFFYIKSFNQAKSVSFRFFKFKLIIKIQISAPSIFLMCIFN